MSRINKQLTNNEMKRTEQQNMDTLFNMIPNSLYGRYTIITDQINGKTFALAKINKEYSERYNFGHDTISNFMTYNEMKAYLMGMQELIRINNLNKRIN